MSNSFPTFVHEANITSRAIVVSCRSGHNLTPFHIVTNDDTDGSGLAIAYCRDCNAVALINEDEDNGVAFYGTAFDANCGQAIAIADLHNVELTYPHIGIAMLAHSREAALVA